MKTGNDLSAFRIFSNMEKIRITHFSDMLCVWAYISEIRLSELKNNYGEKVQIEFHFFNVFGNTGTKFSTDWKERGGNSGYAEHVLKISSKYDHISVHPDIWNINIPESSIPCHIFLCAVKQYLLEEGDENYHSGELLEKTAWLIRESFFRDLIDVSRKEELLNIAERLELPIKRLEKFLDNGKAHALYSSDLDLAKVHNVRASPTMIFNEGRQTLMGNVGYRVIDANIRELFHTPLDQKSWC